MTLSPQISSMDAYHTLPTLPAHTARSVTAAAVSHKQHCILIHVHMTYTHPYTFRMYCHIEFTDLCSLCICICVSPYMLCYLLYVCHCRNTTHLLCVQLEVCLAIQVVHDFRGSGECYRMYSRRLQLPNEMWCPVHG